jgi:hypothetical protein
MARLPASRFSSHGLLGRGYVARPKTGPHGEAEGLGAGSGAGNDLLSLTRFRSILGIMLFGAVVAGLSYRAAMKLNIPGKPDIQRWVMADFRDVIYYPIVAVIQGKNPYDAPSYVATYPVRCGFVYPPLTLLVHLPFGLLPFRAAELAYYVFTIVLTVTLARLLLFFVGADRGWTLGLAALILASRPGHWNLLLGQSTVQCVIGAYLALALARRPWAQGLGLALATIKPNFGFPLAVLLLSRRDVRPVMIGASVAGVVSATLLFVFVQMAGGVHGFIGSLAPGLAAAAADVPNSPLGHSRIDAIALVSRLLDLKPAPGVQLALGLSFLALGALGVRRLAAGAAGDVALRLSASLACVTVLLCVYHQGYCLLLLTLPLTAVVADRAAPPWVSQPGLRRVLLVALAIPMINYLPSATAITALGITGAPWLVITSVNGTCLVVAMAVYLWLAFQPGVSDRTARAADLPKSPG